MPRTAVVLVLALVWGLTSAIYVKRTFWSGDTCAEPAWRIEYFPIEMCNAKNMTFWTCKDGSTPTLWTCKSSDCEKKKCTAKEFDKCNQSGAYSYTCVDDMDTIPEGWWGDIQYTPDFDCDMSHMTYAVHEENWRCQVNGEHSLMQGCTDDGVLMVKLYRNPDCENPISSTAKPPMSCQDVEPTFDETLHCPNS